MSGVPSSGNHGSLFQARFEAKRAEIEALGLCQWSYRTPRWWWRFVPGWWPW